MLYCAWLLSHVRFFCYLIDYSPPGSSVHRILQASVLGWVATPSSRGSSQPRNRNHVSYIGSNFFTTSVSQASKVMLKILQARLQQYVNHEIPDVQAGFRRGRRIRDQIANIRWIIEKARGFQKNIYFCFMDYAKVFDCETMQSKSE